MKDYQDMSREELIAALESQQPEAKPQGPEPSETEEFLRAILKTAVEGIITIDEKGIIISVNSSAETMFGYAAQEMVGQNVNMLMPSPYRENHQTYLDNYHRTGHAKIIGIGREVAGQRKDGSTFPMDLSVSEVKLPGKHHYAGFIRDLSNQEELEKEVLSASEKEQRRIGQDLHDGLCQHLAGIEFMSQALAQKLARSSRRNADSADAIAGEIRKAITHTRDLAHGLSPVIVQPDGLMASLKLLAENVSELFRMKCTFSCPHPVLVHDNAVATHLFRIAQEAVNNAIRHGQSQSVDIRLVSTANRITLAIHDDGCGIPDNIQHRRGLGLRIMQYRAGLIGGSLAIQKEETGGTAVICSLHKHAVT